MPDHETWFRFIPNYEVLRAAMEGRLGATWIGKQTLDIQHIGGAMLVLAILATLGLMLHRKVADARAAVVPESRLTVRTFFEVVTEMVLRQMESLMGPKEARAFLPLIGTCAFFILLANSMGMIPGFAPPTANLNTTLGCAAIVVFTAEVYGFKRHGLGYLKEFFGGLGPGFFLTPIPYLVFVIEVVSHLARLLSLSVRLMGNMYSDHTVVGVFLTLVPFVPVFVPLPVQLLGVLVVVVQTVVFCLLSMVYIGLAVGGHEEHEDAHA
ncbi:MAG: F0F1 ATP synthase subunit A [Myxococcota bacterium]|nr:F0F1 ATP synthase subunit A [Myxococcota bacterium]